jgi:hypothetical protein
LLPFGTPLGGMAASFPTLSRVRYPAITERTIRLRPDRV